MQHDWQKIRTEYITTNISQRDIGKKHNVPYTTLKIRAKKEEWFKKRKEYQLKLDAKSTQETQKIKVEAAKNMTETMIDIVKEMIEDVKNNFKNSLDYREKRTYILNLKDLVPTLHLLTGKPTEITQNENINKEEWQEFTSVFLDD